MHRLFYAQLHYTSFVLCTFTVFIVCFMYSYCIHLLFYAQLQCSSFVLCTYRAYTICFILSYSIIYRLFYAHLQYSSFVLCTARTMHGEADKTHTLHRLFYAQLQCSSFVLGTATACIVCFMHSYNIHRFESFYWCWLVAVLFCWLRWYRCVRVRISSGYSLFELVTCA